MCVGPYYVSLLVQRMWLLKYSVTLDVCRSLLCQPSGAENVATKVQH